MNLRRKFIGAQAQYRSYGLKFISMVGEHCGRLRRYTVRSAGGSTRAYVDTSSEKQGEKPCRRKPKVSCSQVNLLRVSRLLRRGREA